jgi:hypothetical protein
LFFHTVVVYETEQSKFEGKEKIEQDFITILYFLVTQQPAWAFNR